MVQRAKQIKTLKKLREQNKKTRNVKYDNEVFLKKNSRPQNLNKSKLYEGNFIKNALSKAKDFSKRSVSYIKKNAKKILAQFKRDFLSPKTSSNFKPGKMLAMNYSAKDITKRYDKNPLIICLGPPKNFPKTHTLGLNMHWMKTSDRVKVASFFVELLEKKNGELTYDDVKPFMSKFKGSPVLRMYIIRNIGNKVIEMPSDQFLTAAAIPSEKWIG